MQITNLTADVYDLPGLRVHGSETVSFDVARYTGDDHFRLEVNTLYGNGKISVASVPQGFPIATSFEAEIARGEAPGVSASGASVEVALGAPGNFDIVVTPNVVNQGAVSFHAVNSDGAAITHEFLLVKTAMTAAAWIAAAPIGGAVDESGLDIRIDTGDIRQGGDSSAVVTLEPGHYLAVCNEPGHSHNGMAVDFTVDATPGGESPVSWIAVFDSVAATIPTPDLLHLIGDLVPDGVAGPDLAVSDDGFYINVLTPGLYVCTAEITLEVANGATNAILQVNPTNDLLPNYGNPGWGSAPVRNGSTQIDTSAVLTAQFVDEFGSFFFQSSFLGGTGPEEVTLTATVFRLR